MFQFRQFPSCTYLIQYRIHGYESMWVSPFRNLRIKAYLQLPAAYRSLSRLSSAPSAKAFALRPYSLDRFYGFPFRYSSRKSNPLILHLPTKKFSVFEIAVSNYIYFLSFAVTIQFSRCKFWKMFQIQSRVTQRFIWLILRISALLVSIVFEIGGLKWTRTTDLALIRRAL